MNRMTIHQAQYLGGLTVALSFQDGHRSIIDVGDWIRQHPHPQYDRFLDEKKFKQFYIDHTGNIAWGKSRDLCFPIEELYDGKIE